jgi:hypothetical protein
MLSTPVEIRVAEKALPERAPVGSKTDYLSPGLEAHGSRPDDPYEAPVQPTT